MTTSADKADADANADMSDAPRRRVAMPPLSQAAWRSLQHYEEALRLRGELRPATIRNYTSDLRHFLAWYEAAGGKAKEATPPLPTPQQGMTQDQQDEDHVKDLVLSDVTPSRIEHYLHELQRVGQVRPTTLNRTLSSTKRYLSRIAEAGLLSLTVVQGMQSTRSYSRPGEIKRERVERRICARFSEADERSLLTTVHSGGNLRDIAVFALLLETGIRARELCALTREQGELALRYGHLIVPTTGKGMSGKLREVPLWATSHAALAAYLPTLRVGKHCLFPSAKSHGPLTVRVLRYLLRT